MIPIRLKLNNFLPYRAPDSIYFEGIHLACLTGHNGAGKSSLLDAITWVLWGKARGVRPGGRRVDDLVHLGQSEMYVQLDFEQEGTIYRVVRQHKAGRRSQGALDLFAVQADGTLRTLNEPSKHATQERINALLRLDYDTFVNSAFLQQGKADAFTTKTPAERKKVLSDILGLDQWRVYEERVKEEIDKLKITVAVRSSRINEIDEKLAQEPQLQRDLQAAQAAEASANQALKEAEARLAEVADAPAELRNAQTNQADIERRLRDYRSDSDAVQAEIRRREATIAQHETIVAQADQIQQGYATLQTARETDTALNEKMRQMSDLDKRHNEIQRHIADARNALERDKTGFETTIREAERVLEGDHSQQLADVQAQITALEEREAERETRQTELGSLREERSAQATTKQTLITEGREMNERIEALAEAQGATCPLCGQPLDADHRERLLAELTAERDDKRARYREATQRIQEIDERVKTTQAHIDALGEALAALPQLRGQAGALAKQQADAAAAQTRREDAQAKLQRLQQTLDEDDYAHEWREQLQAVEAERQALGYDRAAHDDVLQQLNQFRAYEQQHTQLEVARNALPTEKEALANARQRLERLEKAIDDETREQTALSEKIALLKAQVIAHGERQQAVTNQRTAAAQARDRVTIAQQELKALDEQRQSKAELQAELATTREAMAICENLRLAFGKNGVPAMMIEAAIPELEAATNELLARMTDGRMHLRLTTQREKKEGGLMETLEIEIADELGTRPYEMYSGGEAFRINFALRVALSKMLARRAGAHLRTLFIDEGFGTQDDDGRNKLVEAITAIQDDFDLVLVITHIDELRDAFPVHIIVNKTENGSVVRVR